MTIKSSLVLVVMADAPHATGLPTGTTTGISRDNRTSRPSRLQRSERST